MGDWGDFTATPAAEAPVAAPADDFGDFGDFAAPAAAAPAVEVQAATTPAWLLGAASTPAVAPAPATTPGAVASPSGDFGAFAATPTSAIPFGTDGGGSVPWATDGNTAATAEATSTCTAESAPFGSFAAPPTAAVAVAVVAPTLAAAASPAVIAPAVVGSADGHPSTAQGSNPAEIEAIKSDYETKIKQIEATLTTKVAQVEQSRVALETAAAAAAQLRQENEKLALDLNAATSSTDGQQQLLDQLRARHAEELAKERDGSTAHLAKITAEFEAQSKAQAATERERSEQATRALVEDVKAQCFELMKSQQRKLSGILKGDLDSIKEQVQSAVAEALAEERVKTSAQLEDGVAAAKNELRAEFDTVRAEVEAKLTESNAAALVIAEEGFVARHQALVDASTAETAAQQTIAKEFLATEVSKVHEELKTKVEEDRAAAEGLVAGAVAAKTEEYASRVTAAFDEGKSGLERAVQLVREQGKIDAASTAANQVRTLAGVKMFVDTAAQQLAMLQSDLSAPAPSDGTSSAATHAAVSATPTQARPASPPPTSAEAETHVDANDE